MAYSPHIRFSFIIIATAIKISGGRRQKMAAALEQRACTVRTSSRRADSSNEPRIDHEYISGLARYNTLAARQLLHHKLL